MSLLGAIAIVFLFSSVSASTVSLTSNQAESGVCIEDRVVFTCAVTGPGKLEWGVESLFSLGTLDFNVFQDSPGIVPDPFPEVVNVTLVSTVQDSIHPVLGNLTSEITVLVTNTTLEKRVYCSDGILVEDESPSIVIRKKGTINDFLKVSQTMYLLCAVPPPEPLISSMETNRIAEYSVSINWFLPNYTESLDYNIIMVIVYKNESVYMRFFTSNSTMNFHSLEYNTDYSVTISVTNCFGEKNSTTHSFLQGECIPQNL